MNNSSLMHFTLRAFVLATLAIGWVAAAASFGWHSVKVLYRAVTRDLARRPAQPPRPWPAWLIPPQPPQAGREEL